jgi:hypothetical protein
MVIATPLKSRGHDPTQDEFNCMLTSVSGWQLFEARPIETIRAPPGLRRPLKRILYIGTIFFVRFYEHVPGGVTAILTT